MEHEVEAIGQASVGALGSGASFPVKSGEPCENCGDIVEKRYCSACGQLGTNFHRPIWGLLVDSISDMFTVDSRLWRSLPMLLFRPGRMTRNYLEGQRVRYVPPFRMFLLASVIFFLSLFGLSDRQGWFNDWKVSPGVQGVSISVKGEPVKVSTQAEVDALRSRLADLDLSEEERAALEMEIKTAENGLMLEEVVKEDGTIDRAALKSAILDGKEGTITDEELNEANMWLDKAIDIYENPSLLANKIREWAPRFSLLFLPVFSLILALTYAWHRRKYLYDHLIFGLHFQTFIFLYATAAILLGSIWSWGAGAMWILAAPVLWLYLYRQLRVTYDTGHVLAGLRALILLISGVVTVVVLMLIMLGISALGA